MTVLMPHKLAELRTDSSLTFRVPGPLPGMNEIIEAKGAYDRKTGLPLPQVYAKMKRDWHQKVQTALMAQRIHCQTEGAWRFAFVVYEPSKRRDPDNFLAGARKIILDALQPHYEKHPIAGRVEAWAGILKGDGWRHIAGFDEPRWFVDKSSPRVEVTMRRVPVAV